MNYTFKACNLDTSLFVEYVLCKYFLTFWNLSLYTLKNGFGRSKVLNVDEVQDNIFPFVNFEIRFPISTKSFWDFD